MATLRVKAPALSEVPAQQGMPEALDMLPTPLLFWNKSNQELWANAEFVKIYGPVANQHFENAKPVYELKNRPLHLEVFSTIGRHEGFVLQTKDNKKSQIEIKVNRFGKSKTETFVVMIVEVNAKIELHEALIEAHLQLKHNQQAIIQAEKLASLGRLSSGITHELNQPLQAILGFSQELTETEKLSPTGMEFLNDILQAAVKMREIIKSVRIFARDAGDVLTPTSVEHAVLESEKLTRHQLLQSGVTLEFDASKNVPFINANLVQLEQVIVNLINNAKDAIESTGRTDGKIFINLRNTKTGVVLKIQDNGCGMSEETKAQIFDPFFTTKEIGKGTGLGLSITHGILKNFGAEVHVTSEVNKGTIFTLTFKPIERET